MNWKEILPEIYSKIIPTRGYLNHQISELYYKGKIESIWVEFELPNFDYNDPFYGLMKSSNNFKMHFTLCCGDLDVDFLTILDIENQEFEFEKDDLIGLFSNSLAFSVPSCKFGEIVNGHINIDLTYILTNSESYPYLDGNIKDHSALEGTIQTSLEVKELLISIHKNKNVHSILKQLDSDVYDINKISLATDLNYSSDHSITYRIPFLKL